MIFLGVVIIVYFFSLLFFTYVWQKKSPDFQLENYLKVSVIVAYRNERERLPRLLESFKQIKYPTEALEFIFVDDHSEDESLLILNKGLQDFPYQYKLIAAPEHRYGKKEAMIAGVSQALGEIICTTDADCKVGENWVHLMQKPFHDDNIQLVSGNVVFESKKFTDRIFQMEFAPLIGVGGVSIRLGKPSMANGANMAFKRSTFLQLDVYNDNLHIPTGDDVFLLQKIAAKYNNGVFFQKEAIVFTPPPVDLISFTNQRIRWASKWKAGTEKKNKLPALLIWIFHFVYLIMLFSMLIEGEYLWAAAFFILKSLAEFSFIYAILKSQHQKFSLLSFLVLQVFYSFYIVIFGLLANFATYEWKGRKYGKYER